MVLMGASVWSFLRPQTGELLPVAQRTLEDFLSGAGRQHFREIIAAVPEAAFGWLQLSKPPPGVVAAEHKFAKRRLEHLSNWKPAQDELSKLRGLVNRKAGREIL